MTDTHAKVAVVTGTSGGIGRAVALRLARDGFRVVLNYAGNAGNAEAAVAEIKAGDGHAFTVRADVADAAAVERLFQETLGAFGRIDVVVNCAGIMPIGPIAEASLEIFDRVIATNLRGSFIVLAQAAKHVANGGRILMFSSSVIAKSFPGYGPYIASKAGVEGLVHVLANELSGIETSIIVPGAFTGGTNHFAHAGSPADKARAAEYEAGPYAGSLTKCSKASLPSCRPMRMSLQSRTPSSRWSIPPLASDLSGCTLTPRRMARRSPMLSRIVSAQSSFVGLASATCWHREHSEVDFWSVGGRRNPGACASERTSDAARRRSPRPLRCHRWHAGPCRAAVPRCSERIAEGSDPES